MQVGGASEGGVMGVGAGQWWGWRKVGRMCGGLVVW